MERKIDELRHVLRPAYTAGRAEHPSISLEFEPFVRHLTAVAALHETGALGVREAAEQYAADLYLATACELDCDGAWSRWADLFADPLRAYAVRRGASPADADEVVASLPGDLLQRPAHDRFATHMGSYRGSGSLFAWLGRIVDRRLADCTRESRSDSAGGDARDECGGSGPAESMIHTETGQRVARAFESALRDLSARDFELLVLRYRGDLSQKEIAEREGVTPPRISFLLKRILTRVRNHVLTAIPDETSAYWLGDVGLAAILKEVIASILEKER